MIYQILKKAIAATDVDVEIGVPTNAMDKSFQIVVTAVGEGDALATNVAASLAATVAIHASNDRKHWHEVLAPKTVTKASGDTTAADHWAPTSAPWGYYRAVVSSVDAGAMVDVFMCMV